MEGISMRLTEIPLFEARDYDLPVRETGAGESSIWYALEDEEDDEYKGFMEVTRYKDDDITEISYFMIPDLYQDNGYGALMLELFLDMYIPNSTAESMLIAAYDYTGDYGSKLSKLLSDHGFDIGLDSYKECYLPFDSVYEKLYVKAGSMYDSMMTTLAESMEVVASALNEMEDSFITAGDIRDADPELSVAAIDGGGNVKALLLASGDIDRKEVEVTDLYVAPDSTKILRPFFSFTVENAAGSSTPPEFISFAAADEKLEKVMTTFLDPPQTSAVVTAEAEFNLGKYVEQLKIAESLGR